MSRKVVTGLASPLGGLAPTLQLALVVLCPSEELSGPASVSVWGKGAGTLVREGGQ